MTPRTRCRRRRSAPSVLPDVLRRRWARVVPQHRAEHLPRVARRPFDAVMDPLDEEQHSDAQCKSDPEVLMHINDAAALITRAMSHVPDRVRELLVLREVEGLCTRARGPDAPAHRDRDVAIVARPRGLSRRMTATLQQYGIPGWHVLAYERAAQRDRGLRDGLWDSRIVKRGAIANRLREIWRASSSVGLNRVAVHSLTRRPSPRQRGWSLSRRFGLVERVARDVRVPVHEPAVRIVLPGPHVQRIERVEPEPVWAVEQVKQLTHELAAAFAWVLRLPGSRGHEKVSSGDPDAAVRAGSNRMISGCVDVDVPVRRVAMFT